MCISLLDLNMTSEKALQDEVDKLTKLLADNEEKLSLAAQIGQQLLTDNQELEIRYENLRIESNQRIEELEQQNHVVNLRNQTIKCKYDNLANDMEMMKSRREQDIDRKYKEVNEDLKKQLAKLQRQNEVSAEEVDRYRTLTNQLTEKIQGLENMIEKEQQHNHHSLNLSDNNNEQIEELQDNLATIVEINKDMELQNINLRHDKDALNLQLQSANKQVQSLQEYQQVIESEVDTWRTKYNDVRIECSSLSEQLMDYQSQSNYQANPSKSLFSEVDDQRIKLEGCYKRLKVKFDALEKQYNECRQQIQQLKGRYSSLLTMCNSRADEAKMETLERNLSQSQADCRTLSVKVQELEEQLETVTNSNIEHAKCLESVNLSEKDYIDFLGRELQEYKRNFCKLTNETKSLRLMNTSESQKLRQTEYSLSEVQKIADKLKIDNIKIRSKLEEEIMKRKQLQDELRIKQDSNVKNTSNTNRKNYQSQKENFINTIESNLTNTINDNYSKVDNIKKQSASKHVKFDTVTTVHYQPLQDLDDVHNESVSTTNVDEADTENLRLIKQKKHKHNVIHVPSIDDNPNKCKQQ